MRGSPTSPPGRSPAGPHPNPPPPSPGQARGGEGARRIGGSRKSPTSEAALYGPVKRFLERLGYEVKGEVRGCDLVARRGDEPAVIVELKLRFNLALVLQGVDRLALSERVYVAVPRPGRSVRGLVPDAPRIRRLCRRLGLGLILVGEGTVAVVEEPVPYRPRPAHQRAARLILEFERREGDMNVGGQRRTPIVTAYRQDALRCARALAANGPLHLAQLRTATGVADAAPILQRNVYGWFTRIGRGVYALSDRGREALGQFAEAVAALADPGAVAGVAERAVA
jgi:hypothetical protein